MNRLRRAIFWLALTGMAAWTFERQVEPWRVRFELYASFREQWAESGEAVFSWMESRRQLRAALPSAPSPGERFAMYCATGSPNPMTRNMHLFLSMVLRPQPVHWTSAPESIGADWVCSYDTSSEARVALAGYERVDNDQSVLLYRRLPAEARP